MQKRPDPAFCGEGCSTELEAKHMVSDGFQRNRQNRTSALVGSYDFYNNHWGWCDLPYSENRSDL
jgi:hypothetical protein